MHINNKSNSIKKIGDDGSNWINIVNDNNKRNIS